MLRRTQLELGALVALSLVASCSPAAAPPPERDAARETADPAARDSSAARPDPLDVYEPGYTPPPAPKASRSDPGA